MNRNAQPRSPRAMHRLSAFVVALLWCAVPVLAVIHASAEAHRYCVEHGTVEDAGDEVVETASDSPAVRDGGESADHEDCRFAKVCRFGQVLAQVVIDAIALPAPPLHPAPALVTPPPAVATLLLAPKTSPPV